MLWVISLLEKVIYGTLIKMMKILLVITSHLEVGKHLLENNILQADQAVDLHLIMIMHD